MMSQSTFELIERYLDNNLTACEKFEFEKRMAEDREFDLEVRKIQQANEQIYFLGMANNLEIIKQAEKNYFTNRNQTYIRKGIVGGLILFLTGFFLIYLNSDNSKNNFQEIHNPPIKNSDIISNEQATPKSNAITSHFSGNNKNTIKEKRKESNITTTSPLIDIPIITESKIVSDEIQEPILAKKNNQFIESEIPVNKPCSGNLTANIQAIATCKDKNEGQLVISNITGGEGPFRIRLNNKEFFNTTELNFLAEDVYTVFIKDVNNCSSSKFEVNVPSKSCAKIKDLVYSSASEIPLELPATITSNFIFLIQNLAGETITIVEVQNGLPFSWNGLDKNNNPLPLGIYPYKILNKENDIIQLGNITIIN